MINEEKRDKAKECLEEMKEGKISISQEYYDALEYVYKKMCSDQDMIDEFKKVAYKDPEMKKQFVNIELLMG